MMLWHFLFLLHKRTTYLAYLHLSQDFFGSTVKVRHVLRLLRTAQFWGQDQKLFIFCP